MGRLPVSLSDSFEWGCIKRKIGRCRLDVLLACLQDGGDVSDVSSDSRSPDAAERASGDEDDGAVHTPNQVQLFPWRRQL